MTRANQGKKAEEKVRRLLKAFTEQWQWFDFERLPDARTGYYIKRPADFAFFIPAHHGLIEVKSVQHDYRLPRRNLTQLEKMYRRVLAGGTVFVLVEHSTTGLWRMPNFSWLYQHRDQPSWDLQFFQAYRFSDLKKRFEAIFEGLHDADN